jgi:hypothetical protein
MGTDRCDIIAAGLRIAVMNKKTHLALNSLASHPAYRGMIPRQELQQQLAAADISLAVAPPKVSCAMAILVSGPRSMAKSLAKQLSKYRLYLQHPNPKPADLQYENPQYLSMVGSWLSNGAVLPPISLDSFGQDEDRRDSVERPAEDDVDLRCVIDNLPQPAYLREADIDGRVTATLEK